MLARIANDFAELIADSKNSVVVITNGHDGAGAGIIWPEDGCILTNNHVARKDKLIVFTNTGQELAARVIARNPEHDLALLEIQKTGQKSLATKAISDVRPGEIAIAIGHPLGNINHVTFGVISSIDKAWTHKDGEAFPIVRTDLTLLPGNSGGPLLDAAGKVIGINAMVVGGDQGYAIPIHLANSLLDDYHSGVTH